MTMRMSRSICAVLLSSALVACGGGYGGDSYGGGAPAPPPAPGSFTVGGSVQGLNGTVVLANGSDTASVTATGGAAPFTFSAAIAGGASYNVTVQTQPSNQSCTVANGAGAIVAANVTNVAVTCTDNPVAAQVTVVADPGVRSVTLSWTDTSPTPATSFNIYQCATPACDIGNTAPILRDVTSPQKIGQLENGQVHSFRVEIVNPNGASTLSSVASARPNALAFDGTVRAIARADDGTVYLGGDFTGVGLASGSAVPLNGATGRPIAADFPVVSGIVSTIVADGAGGWFIGGSFTHVAGLERRNLAHILAGGNLDPQFDPQPDQAVLTLAYRQNILYVGGFFNRIDELDRSALAALDAQTGAALADFNAGLSEQSLVHALAVSGNTLYVGGEFIVDATGQGSCIAPFNAQSGALAPFTLQADCDVRAIAVAEEADATQTIYVAGDFQSLGGVERPSVAALHADGDVIETFNAFAAPGVIVSALAIAGNSLFVGGQFESLGGRENFNLAGLDRRDGIALNGFNASANDSVLQLAVSGDTLYVGGFFDRIGAVERSHVAALDLASGAARELDVKANGAVSALAVSGDTVYIGGFFNSVDRETRNHLAALNSDGELLGWNPDADATVRALVVTAGAAPIIYAGGEFTRIDNLQRDRVAAIDSTGNPLDAFNPPAISNPRPVINALALNESSGLLYVGGDFTMAGAARTHLAALDLSTGVAAPAFLGGNPSAPVRALAVAGQALYVGGEFQQIRDRVGNFLLLRIAALHAQSGDVLPGFANGANNSVLALGVSGTTVHAGGSFSEIGLQPRRNLAALNALSGEVDLAFNPAPTADVRALAVSGDTLYAGGFFSEIGDVPRLGIAALDASGAVQSFQADVVEGTVEALSAFGDTVYVGGSFQVIGGQPRFNFASVAADGAVR